MSLDIASTVLSTAWSEFSVVNFTAGTLPSVSACADEVEGKIRRGTLSATSTPTLTQVYTWLIRAKEELAEVRKFTWRKRYVTAVSVAGTYRYGLPPDYGGGEIKLRDVTNDNVIRFIDNNQFDVLFPDVSEETSGESVVATIKNRELWVAPPPDGADIFELEYSRTGDDITTTDFSWLPELERFRCCDFATAEAFASLHDLEKAQFYLARWDSGVKKAIMADGKRKWSQIGYRARSVFQAG